MHSLSIALLQWFFIVLYSNQAALFYSSLIAFLNSLNLFFKAFFILLDIHGLFVALTLIFFLLVFWKGTSKHCLPVPSIVIDVVQDVNKVPRGWLEFMLQVVFLYRLVVVDNDEFRWWCSFSFNLKQILMICQNYNIKTWDILIGFWRSWYD